MTKTTKTGKNSRKREIAVIDAETDPFLYGRTPKPFAWGFKWGDVYMDFWGKSCTKDLLSFLASIETPLIIYAHNGGKFDFYFLLAEIENPVKIIHGRIAKAKIGIHEIRDSWLINPQKLSAYKKDDIDYALFERGIREKHKPEILSYLRGDCCYLYDLCVAFVDRFGPKLTAPGAAITELRKIHPQLLGKESHDSKFRPFYFGGRTQAFHAGIANGKFKVYDVNSMYPYVMREFDHPHGTKYVFKDSPILDKKGWIKGFPNCLYFAIVEGINNGGLPMRIDTPGPERGHLSFTSKQGTYFACSHEIVAGIETGMFTPTRVVEAYIACNVQRFAAFVDKFHAEKVAAKASKDKIAEIFSKLILNSAYGKFGQNPRDFRDYYLERRGIDLVPNFDDYELYESSDTIRMWRKRKSSDEESDLNGFFDVAIAASITSAARSVLMRAIRNAKRPMYCDTDSLICEELRGVTIDDKALGAWKFEANGNELAIAGKKLYCLFDDGEPVKYASKGVHIEPADIRAIARGGSIEWRNEAPSFDLTGSVSFVKRSVKATR